MGHSKLPTAILAREDTDGSSDGSGSVTAAEEDHGPSAPTYIYNYQESTSAYPNLSVVAGGLEVSVISEALVLGTATGDP